MSPASLRGTQVIARSTQLVLLTQETGGESDPVRILYFNRHPTRQRHKGARHQQTLARHLKACLATIKFICAKINVQCPYEHIIAHQAIRLAHRLSKYTTSKDWHLPEAVSSTLSNRYATLSKDLNAP